MRLKTFARDLRRAVRDDNDTQASDLIHELDMADLMVTRFPEKHFRILCSVMRTRPFRRSVKAAPHVLHFFTLEQWENLSPNQKRRLLAELEWLYPRVTASAWNLCFLVTVLLGEQFRDEQALKVLLRLAEFLASMLGLSYRMVSNILFGIAEIPLSPLLRWKACEQWQRTLPRE